MPKKILDTNQSLLEVKIVNRNAGTENKAYNKIHEHKNHIMYFDFK